MDSGVIATHAERILRHGMQKRGRVSEAELEVRGYRLCYRAKEGICCDDLSEPSFWLPRLAPLFPSPFTLPLETRSLNAFKLGAFEP